MYTEISRFSCVGLLTDRSLSNIPQTVFDGFVSPFRLGLTAVQKPNFGVKIDLALEVLV